jgi:hypothetical protein
MVKNKNKNLIKKENIENKRKIKYKGELYSKRFAQKFLKCLLLIIFLNSISLTKERSLEIRILDNDSIITMIINGGGKKRIIGGSFSFSPEGGEVYINNKKQDGGANDEYELDIGQNIVIIKFQNQLQSCANMFYNMTDLLEVDLSKFDASQISSTSEMFYGCKNLKKVVMENFASSKIGQVYRMFAGCSSLVSLKLKFDFFLEGSMEKMFSGCENLIYLDLPNFLTWNRDISFVLENCISLKYLNLKQIKSVRQFSF